MTQSAEAFISAYHDTRGWNVLDEDTVQDIGGGLEQPILHVQAPRSLKVKWTTISAVEGITWAESEGFHHVGEPSCVQSKRLSHDRSIIGRGKMDRVVTVFTPSGKNILHFREIDRIKLVPHASSAEPNSIVTGGEALGYLWLQIEPTQKHGEHHPAALELHLQIDEHVFQAAFSKLKAQPDLQEASLSVMVNFFDCGLETISWCNEPEYGILRRDGDPWVKCHAEFKMLRVEYAQSPRLPDNCRGSRLDNLSSQLENQDRSIMKDENIKALHGTTASIKARLGWIVALMAIIALLLLRATETQSVLKPRNYRTITGYHQIGLETQPLSFAAS